MNLTKTEMAYLELLQKNSGTVVPREDLLEVGVISKGYKRLSNLVDAHIRNLRNKIGKEPFTIEVVRGFGYKLVPKQ